MITQSEIDFQHRLWHGKACINLAFTKQQSLLIQCLNKRMGFSQAIPALNYVLFAIDNKYPIITGKNLTIKLDGSGYGVVAVPIRQVLNGMTGVVEITESLLKFGESEITWEPFNIQDLPAPYTTNMKDHFARFTVSSDELQKRLSMVVSSQAQDSDPRYYLVGTLFEIDKGLMAIVSTDGHRLSTTKIVIDEQYSLNQECRRFILKKEDITTIVSLLKTQAKKQTSIIINFFTRAEEYYVEFSCDDWAIICRCIDANYPNWKEVIPPNQTFITLTKVDVKAIMKALKLHKGSPHNGVKIELDDTGIFTVLSKKNGIDTRIDKIQIETQNNPALSSRGFSSVYLIDALKSVASADHIILGFSDEHTQISIRGDDFIGVVMPMRI